MTSNDLQRIQSLLCSVAADAGKFILDIYSKGTFVVRKKTDNSPVTAADIGSQELILSFLEKHFPDIPIVSEELADSANKIATRELFFLVDPLDSTKNFVTGIPFFNISLALVHKGLTIVGVIRDPVHEITYGAYRGGGATKNATPIHVRPCASLTDADLDVNATKLQEEPYRRIAFEIMPTAKKVRYFGSAVLETCWIAGGALDAVSYTHLTLPTIYSV